MRKLPEINAFTLKSSKVCLAWIVGAGYFYGGSGSRELGEIGWIAPKAQKRERRAHVHSGVRVIDADKPWMSPVCRFLHIQRSPNCN